MNQKLVETVVNAVLYEGHRLYPYRASVKNNRSQSTFGRVYPESYSLAENGAEPCSMQTQCLVEGAPTAMLNIAVRFLQPMTCDIGALAAPLRKMPASDNRDFFHIVAGLRIDGRLHESSQEMVERSVLMPVLTLFEFCEEPLTIPFSFAPFRAIEPILDRSQHIAGVVVRQQEEVEGSVELSCRRLSDELYKVTIRIVNQTRVPSKLLDDTNEIVMRTFASTHTILSTPHAQFISLIDPPVAYAEAAAGCRNLGTWPILIGKEEKDDRKVMLSSPVVLYDYPEIEVEDSDALFDGGESDEEMSVVGTQARRGHEVLEGTLQN